MYKLGDFELHAVSDGTFKLDGGAMFGIVPKPVWEKVMPADERNRIPLSLTCLLIKTGITERLTDSVRTALKLTGGAVLISVGVRSLQEGGWVHALAGVAVWGAIVVAVVAIIGGQQAYARGALAWSLPALILMDPLAAIPAAKWLLGERLEPGHAVVWVPAAIVAAIGVVLLARTGEPHGPPDRRPDTRPDAGPAVAGPGVA